MKRQTFAKQHGINPKSLRSWSLGEALGDTRKLEARAEYEKLRAEGLSPYKCSLILDVAERTIRNWSEQCGTESGAACR